MDHSTENPQPQQVIDADPIPELNTEKYPFLDPAHAPLPPRGILRRQHWLTVLMPFLVYMFVQFGFESRLADSPAIKEQKEQARIEALDGKEEGPIAREERLKKEKEEESHSIPYDNYPFIYCCKIGLTLAAMILVIPGYRYFRGGVHPLSVVIGGVGAAAWIVLSKAQVAFAESLPASLGAWFELNDRAGFNPLEYLQGDPAWAKMFLGIRFFGLCVVVPVIEEFFLRGFLMRYVMHVDWPYIPFARVDRIALAVGILFPVLYHPERLAALVWFGMVTWLMLRYKSIWDCIVAHAVTNLLMGLWVVYSGDWWLM